MSTNSKILKAITGVLLIEKDGEDKLVCIEDLGHSKHFSIGQLFNAVRVLNDKSIEQYGDKWPTCSVGTEESNDWKAIKSVYQSTETDLEFLFEVCEQLGEEIPKVVPRDEVLKELEKYRHGTLIIE